MGEPEEEEGRGFKIIDRRGSEEGEASATPPPAAEAPPPPAAEPPPAAGPGPELPGGVPPVDFPTFVLSLATSAFYHMGMAPDPVSGEPTPEPNLPLARQTIDTLQMLQDKTRGNLEPEEAQLLESLLYELRMHFVEASR